MSDRQEDRIRELEERIYCLEDIIQHVSEGVILTDQDCRITVFNPAKEKMEQMKAEDVLNKVSWEVYSHSNREISEHQQVLDTGVPILDAYRPHAYVGEAPVYIYYSTYPVMRDGKVLGVYSISRNESTLRELLYETLEHKRSLHVEDEEERAGRSLAKGTKFTFEDFVGCSPQIKQVIKDAQTIAGLDASILITGETGTGKEVLAQSIHNFGRGNKRFVAVNCAAIPDTLMESTMFGSVKGAFTGAVDSQGLLRAAEDGTLFLDEINSMSVAMQAKLLRALQERCVRPVGSMDEYPIQCRLICASNESAGTLLRDKLMRQDLFYRISDCILAIPPLREYLLNSAWRGNIRELERVLRSLMLRVSEVEEELDVQADIGSLLGYEKAAAQGEASYLATTDLQETLRQIQMEIITHRLKENNGNISKTARDLGLQRQNLSQRIKRLELGDPL